MQSEAGSLYKKTAGSVYTTQEPDAELAGPEIYKGGELAADGHGIYQMDAGERAEMGGGGERAYELDGGGPVELAGSETYVNPKRGSGGSTDPALRDFGGLLSPMGHSNSVGSVSSTSELMGRRTPSPLSRRGTPLRGDSVGSGVVSPLATPRIGDFTALYESPGR